jgi:CYTH domain-containing protein
MAKEIERKYLVTSDAWKKCVQLKRVDLKQGYISKSAQHQVRIRISNDKAELTIKGPRKGLTRNEFEYSVPVEDGQQLIRMSVTPVVAKTRYYVRDDTQQVWEVDVYKGTNRGLVVVEIELASEKQSVKLPSWVGREVTHDRRYTNTYLAEHKAPKR